MRLKKHQREIMKAIREKGYEILDVLPHRSHSKVLVRLGDGRKIKVPMSGTPLNDDVAVKLVMSFLQRVERGTL